MTTNTERLIAEAKTVHEFLMGAGTLNGRTFGDDVPGPRFWWRKNLNVIPALIAALPAQEVRVKPLVWDVDGRKLHMDQTMAFSKSYDWDGWDCFRQEGYGLGASYIIWPDSILSERWNLYGTIDGLFIPDLNGDAAAKAAAQADYERRILTALAPAEAGGVEPCADYPNCPQNQTCDRCAGPAEAKAAEVTASNAEWTDLCVKIAQDEMRATVASLTAQVEAMRGAGLALCNAVLADDGSDHHHFTISGLADAFRRAALTTEDQTNG